MKAKVVMEYTYEINPDYYIEHDSGDRPSDIDIAKSVLKLDDFEKQSETMFYRPIIFSMQVLDDNGVLLITQSQVIDN